MENLTLFAFVKDRTRNKSVHITLLLQESIMDFYWHYSGKDSIDAAGKENFCRAIMVSKQVLATLTEYVQVCPVKPIYFLTLCLVKTFLIDILSIHILGLANCCQAIVIATYFVKPDIS